jgi:hypothetical protein
VVRLMIPAALSNDVACTAAISCLPNVLRTMSRPLERGALRFLAPGLRPEFPFAKGRPRRPGGDIMAVFCSDMHGKGSTKFAPF